MVKIKILFFCLILSSVSFFPPFLQKYSEHGCGPKSLSFVMSTLGYTKTNDLQNKFEKDEIFIKLEKLYYIVKNTGYICNIQVMDVSLLRSKKPLGILHVDGSHFVGLVGYDSQTIHIAETGYEGPPRIERWSDGDLMARWDGVILVISKPKDGTIPPVAAQKATQAPPAARLGN